jgi:hypothetical protein
MNELLKQIGGAALYGLGLLIAIPIALLLLGFIVAVLNWMSAYEPWISIGWLAIPVAGWVGCAVYYLVRGLLRLLRRPRHEAGI